MQNVEVVCRNQIGREHSHGISMMRGFKPVHIKMLSTLSVLEVFRMLGIFLVLPVFSVYAEQYTSSGLLIGIGLGSYGIAMAIFQIPMGMLSDRFGRKRVIVIAMIPFIIGNLISWHPVNIFGLIIGRFIAGAGAITSSSMALAQESVPDEKRTAAMAFLGIPIGLSFLVGIILGPLIGSYLGDSSIFLISAILGVLGLIPFILLHLPHPEKKISYMKGRIGIDAVLMGIIGMATSFVLISIFYFLPLYFKAESVSGYEIDLIIPLIIGGLIAIGLSPVAEKGRRMTFAFISMLLIVVSVPLTFAFPISRAGKLLLLLGLATFFTGYSITEIVFTPIISTRVSRESYGLNMGAYNTLQFIGQFAGGSMAGYVLGLNFTTPYLIRNILILESIVVISIIILLRVRFNAIPKNRKGQKSKA